MHGSWAEFLNAVVKGGNLNVATKQFVDIMTDRVRDTLSTQYKIFKDKDSSHYWSFSMNMFFNIRY